MTDDQWGNVYPYVDRKLEQESEFPGIKEGEFAGIAWRYLKEKDPKNLFNDWTSMGEFCDKMRYRTDDIAARGALGQLFDATLYADEQPWNLSARGDMYCTLAIISETAPSGSETPYSPRQRRSRRKAESGLQLAFQSIKNSLIDVSFSYLYRKETGKLREYLYADGTVDQELGKSRPKPFRTYVVEATGTYDPTIGLQLVKRENPNSTEEGTSCQIL